jgi:hypothetical protein
MMNKEKEFNNILDECLDRLIFGGETPNDCIRDYPEFADELRPLLETALETSRVSDIEARPEFRSKARTELNSVLREAEARRSKSFFRFGWQRSWATVTAIVLTLVLATGGTAAASISSMPDDFLYPVKRAAEQVQLAFTFTSLGKAEANARMADTRVEEIVYLANEDEPEKIVVLANSLNTNLMNVAALSSRKQNSTTGSASDESMKFSVAAEMEESTIVSEPAADSNEGAKVTSSELSESVSEEESAPAVIIPDVDNSTINEADKTDETEIQAPKAVPVTNEPARPASVTKVTGQGKTSNSRRDQLNTTVVNQANKNISRLRELLNIVPESARPAILRAIELSEQGYEIAIDSLD